MKLGRGTFSKVYLAKEQKTQKEVAAKCIECEQHHINSFPAKLPSEHRNILCIYSHQTIDSQQEDGDVKIWVFMPFCELGDLNKYSQKHPEEFGILKNKIYLMEQVACGIAFLHENNLVHSNIKPTKILLTRDVSESGGLNSITVKISDWGLSKHLNLTTQRFRAPELWKNVPGAEMKQEVDIFAAGLTFLAMIQPPFANGTLMPRIEGSDEKPEANPIGLTMHYHHLYNPDDNLDVVIDKDDDTSSEKLLKSLIRAATKYDPLQRLSADEMQRRLIQTMSSIET